MNKEESIQDDKLTSPSKHRSLVARKEGRVAHRDGRPPYLEEKELQTLKLRILIETANNHTLQLREVVDLVSFIHLFYFLINFRHTK
jgi:hypothetical protein